MLAYRGIRMWVLRGVHSRTATSADLLQNLAHARPACTLEPCWKRFRGRDASDRGRHDLPDGRPVQSEQRLLENGQSLERFPERRLIAQPAQGSLQSLTTVVGRVQVSPRIPNLL